MLARLLIVLSARLVPADARARWREEWCAELAAVRDRGGNTLAFVAGAPRDALAMRPRRRLLSAVSQDFRCALRHIGSRPGHASAVVACLVIGLVASIATYSVLSALFYGDLPGIKRSGLVRLRLQYRAIGSSRSDRAPRMPLSYDDFQMLRHLPPDAAITAIGAEGDFRLAAAGDHGTVSMTAAFASGDYFTVLGTLPKRGRLLSNIDDRPDAPPVAVISDFFWRTYLDGREDVLGRHVRLGGRPFTIVGVVEPGFHGLDPSTDDSQGIQAWIPLALLPTWPGQRSGEPWLTTIGRLSEGASPISAQRQLIGVATQIAARASTRQDVGVVVTEFNAAITASATETALVVAAILALPLTILAIGCANVANLQLARVAEQSRELAVRAALGATRAQLLRLVTIEALLRVTLATGLSLVLLRLALARLQPLVPMTIALDWRVWLFANALSIGVVLATGLGPAWVVLRKNAPARPRGDQTANPAHARLRSSLVVVQVMLSLALLAMTGLFARSVRAMSLDAPPALRQQLVVTFDPRELRMTPAAAGMFADALVRRAAADNRARGAALATESPIDVSARWASEPAATAVLMAVTPSWNDINDLRVLTGRGLSASDGADSAVLSAHAADVLAPGGSALGQYVELRQRGRPDRAVQVVGVVDDAPARPSTERPAPVIYVPFPASLDAPFSLRIRSNDLDALRTDVANLVTQADPEVTWVSVRRGDAHFQDEAADMSTLVMAAGGAAIAAIVLSATGLFAVMSYIVLLRRREIGIRLAIGAAQRQIVKMVLAYAARLVAIGAAVGVILAVPIAFAVRASFVVTVRPLDALFLVPLAAMLFVAGLLAAAAPAFRAARVDPITTLRQD